MLRAQRIQVLLETLGRTSYLSLSDAMSLTGASEATTRRDFATLESSGRVVRHRGGIQLVGESPIQSAPLESRLGVQDTAKRLIAEKAALLCGEGLTIFVDAGTTTLALARCVTGTRIRVITNSFVAARELSGTPETQVIITGGQVDRNSQVVFSYLDEPMVVSYPADIAFLGARGIDAVGITNTDERLIRTEQVAAGHANRTIILADSSKFGVRGQIRLCGLDQIDAIITDAGVTEQQREMVADAGVELVIA